MKRPQRLSLYHLIVRLGLLGLLALGSCRPLYDRQVAGMILSLEGEAQGTINGKTVRLTKSSRLRPGETVAVSAGGRYILGSTSVSRNAAVLLDNKSSVF
jgi:hypothetical protein